jgi:hypothetical protein
MVAIAPLVKALRTYDADEWEIFVAEWQKGLQGYVEVKRLGGGSDLGRDVIGLTSASACEGVWDNYQCKHYDKPLTLPQASIEIGKIIFYSFEKKYSAPRKSFFVAPRGPDTELRDKLLNPSQLRENILENWDKRISKKINSGKVYNLIGELEKYVRAFDFSVFGYKTPEEILDDHRKTAFWTERFFGMLPPPGPVHVPLEIAAIEEVYVRCLLDVFGEDNGCSFAAADDLSTPELSTELRDHRERFYLADSFAHHYRDQTAPGTVEDFAEEIFDAVEPALVLITTPSRARLSKAMEVAAQTAPASILAPRARVRVKQGVCHQLANNSRLKWHLNGK